MSPVFVSNSPPNCHLNRIIMSVTVQVITFAKNFLIDIIRQLHQYAIDVLRRTYRFVVIEVPSWHTD